MNAPIPLYALVLEEEIRKSKNESFFWQVILKTKIGNIKAFMWNATSDAATNHKFPHKGDIIEVFSFEDNLADRGNIIISAFQRIDKSELPKDSQAILEFEKASNEDIEEALSIIMDDSIWEDKSNYDFTMRCLADLDREKLIACPAAVKVHHNYYGGLVIHTSEVLNYSHAIANLSKKRYDFLSRDVLYASSILHDIGKVFTYYINDFGIAQTLKTEYTIGHLYYGMSLVERVHKETRHNEDFVNEVLHCIASHHGSPEFGSIKEVQSIEAGILSRMDYISSRNGIVESVLNENIKSGIPLQDNFKIYKENYFASMGMNKYVKTVQSK